jgi:hypothetical protein
MLFRRLLSGATGTAAYVERERRAAPGVIALLSKCGVSLCQRNRMNRIVTPCLALTLLGCGAQADADLDVPKDPCTAEVLLDDGISSREEGTDWTGRAEWVEVAQIPTPRFAYAAAAVRGRIHVVGGLGAGSVHEVYDPENDTWYRAPDLPVSVHHAWAAAVRDWLFVGGGTSDQVFCFDVEVGEWTEVVSPPARHGVTPAVAVIEDRIYVAGGFGAGMEGDELSMYDPLLDQWVSLTPMNCSRHHTVGGAIGGRMHVAGGRPGSQRCHEAYDPATDEWIQTM